MPAQFNDEQLLRYSRHILLPQVDIAGQLAIANGHALVVGLGGLGSPVALYLASSGVGRLTLVDFDIVDESNLQRQVVHRESRVGQNKAISAMAALSELNQHVEVHAVQSQLEGEALEKAVAAADVVVDCCDNFTTRRAVNRACLLTRTPLVSGAAIRFEGQLSVFDFRDENSPCYECVFPELTDEDLTCSRNGVFAPVVGVIGSMQALEALKLLAGCGQCSTGRLHIFDGLSAQWRELRFARDQGCPACGCVR